MFRLSAANYCRSRGEDQNHSSSRSGSAASIFGAEGKLSEARLLWRCVESSSLGASNQKSQASKALKPSPAPAKFQTDIGMCVYIYMYRQVHM